MEKHCLNCNQKLDDDMLVCPNCGKKVYENTDNLNESEVLKNKEEQLSAYDNKNKINKFALIGFILSLIEPVYMIANVLLSLYLNVFLPLFSIISTILSVTQSVGFIFFVVGLVKCIKRKQRGKVFAIIGILLPVCILIFYFIGFIFLAKFIQALGSMG